MGVIYTLIRRSLLMSGIAFVGVSGSWSPSIPVSLRVSLAVFSLAVALCLQRIAVATTKSRNELIIGVSLETISLFHSFNVDKQTFHVLWCNSLDSNSPTMTRTKPPPAPPTIIPSGIGFSLLVGATIGSGGTQTVSFPSCSFLGLCSGQSSSRSVQ